MRVKERVGEGERDACERKVEVRERKKTELAVAWILNHTRYISIHHLNTH